MTPTITRTRSKRRGPRHAASWCVWATWPGRRTAHRLGTITGRRWRASRAGIALGLSTARGQCLAGGGDWPVARSLIAFAAGETAPQRSRRRAR